MLSIAGHICAGRPYGSKAGEPGDSSERLFACGEDIHTYFGLDQAMVRVPLDFWVCPRFDEEILERTDAFLIQYGFMNREDE